MKRSVVFLLSFFLLLCAVMNGGTAVRAESGTWLNDTQVDKGVIGIKYTVKSGVKTKVLIAKGNEKYTYSLLPGITEENFPLQLGDGEYAISVLEQKSNGKYQVIYEASVNVELEEPTAVYLNSIQNVKWAQAGAAVAKAKALTKNLTTDEQKVKAIYNFVVNNIKYDKKLALNIPADYIPQIDRTLTVGKDTCYGYSALFAAMLRSVNIPTKLDMGKTAYVTTYHAWNEVYMNNKWVVIDTTVDAGWKGTTTKYQMIKDAAKYTADRQY
ncbi:transglutaminase-like domain-containing protein [Paenibacillus tuaregi]|uniref:transglutaminase-like domain-containing protein n=1 Tax=Paenibacillus tuaregi TaxID=1816681 RepID=UPI0008388A90|nr:transglutaminase-like domain-containing protein [Paenibacillus tuaregi]